MSDAQPVPDGVDLEHPNAARIYDWFLGGTANWAIDRVFGEQAVRTFPMTRTVARVNREFLGRGVHYLAREKGIRQFLDLGSGVPTVGNVHEIADSVSDEARCVYVDIEPVAVAHSRVLLEQNGDAERHAVVHADLRDVDHVWKEALATGILDPNEPIGLIIVGVLYFFGPQDRPYEMVARYRDALPSGSYLLSSHFTEDDAPLEEAKERARIHDQYAKSGTMVYARTRAEFAKFFDGFELEEPGVVWQPEWHLDEYPSPSSARLLDKPSASLGIGGLGRKP